VDPRSIVRDGYDRITYRYRPDRLAADDPVAARYRGWLAETLAGVPAGSPVLDLGCGNGIPTARLLVDWGMQVTGVDVSPVQIARARALVPEATFVCADMTTCTFPPSRFAAVVCLYALIHVPQEEQEALLRAIYQWLRPSGRLLAIVGHEAWTGIETGWLGAEDTPMYWSHPEASTYWRWLSACGYDIAWSRFVPEGDGGHELVLARRPAARPLDG